MVHWPIKRGMNRQTDASVIEFPLGPGVLAFGPDGLPKSPHDVSRVAAALRRQNPERFQPLLDHLRHETGRFGRRRYSASGWRQYLAEDADVFLTAVPDLKFLFLAHPSGYFRQAALDRITTLHRSAFLLAVVLWRTNDWVGPVRESASRCVDRVIGEFAAEDILPLIPILALRVPGWRRRLPSLPDQDTIPVLAQGLHPILETPQGRAALATYVMDTPTGPVARVLRLALSHGALIDALGDLATAARNPQARHVAVSTLLERQVRWSAGYRREWVDKSIGHSRRVADLRSRPLGVEVDRGAIILHALADPYARIRVSALDALIADGCTDGFEGSLAWLTSDPSAKVRDRLEFLRRKLALS